MRMPASYLMTTRYPQCVRGEPSTPSAWAYLTESPAVSWVEAIQAFVLRSNPGAGGYLDQNGNDIASYIVQNTDTQSFVLKNKPGVGGFLLRSGSGAAVVWNLGGGGGS